MICNCADCYYKREARRLEFEAQHQRRCTIQAECDRDAAMRLVVERDGHIESLQLKVERLSRELEETMRTVRLLTKERNKARAELAEART